tara:strand:- start:19630 stop:20391 length:762 start_codon:yes stop_codon:yes gene_type:complete
MPSGIPKEMIFQSLFELAGESPSREMLFDTFWRLSGNVPKLLSGTPSHPWNSQRGIETVPVQIMDVKLTRRFGELVYGVLFQFLAGSPCPLKSHQHWSLKKVSFLASRKDENGYGFMFSRSVNSRSKRIVKYPYSDARQLVGMRCLAVVDPDRSDDGPDFQEIKFSSSLAMYNRELLRKRARVDSGYVCPEEFSTTQTCHTCYIGRDKCSAACHDKTYSIDFCKKCDQQAYFDPEDLSSHCVNCSAEFRKKKK